ncbi:uncharacterized protein SCHCODRAFT_02639113 [Schizophyllum commune H4-8]|uniref:uncharacterized protein n=1 Tax=Schizophyllum commune (strain H4-8 / FGSC 9210) TaxID=578458 RepID=UPI00215F13AF|nr:uncharacterized protein SCHCODRAFT_02639113 [Schizophyllum commune H4-8]KAI5887872.1 hypothetical protein SCHCODRAFT_02639113 [Schizophyllum commune H4-8]
MLTRTCQDYERIYHLTSRVREIRNPQYIELLQITNDHPPPRPLFPQLTTLILYGDWQTNTPLHPLLIPFSSLVLSRLHMDLSKMNEREHIDLDAIYQVCAPSVEVVMDMKALHDKPFPAVGRHEILHKLTIKQMDAEGWAFIASLPNLHELDIHRPFSVPALDLLAAVEHPFRALRAFSVFSWRFDCRLFFVDLLRLCGSLSLSTLSIHFWQDDADRFAHPTQHWTLLFLALKRHLSHSTLRSLKLIDQGEMTRIDGSMLQLLAPFSELRTLWIESKNGVVVEDSYVAPLLRSWPALESLTLAPSPYLSEDWDDRDEEDMYGSARWISTCSVRGLLEIARLGTSLKSLALSIDFESGFPVPEDDLVSSCNANITKLDLWNSDMTDPDDVADLILAVFPAAAAKVEVSIVKWKEFDIGLEEGSREEDIEEKWDEVHDIIRLEQSADAEYMSLL